MFYLVSYYITSGKQVDAPFRFSYNNSIKMPYYKLIEASSFEEVKKKLLKYRPLATDIHNETLVYNEGE